MLVIVILETLGMEKEYTLNGVPIYAQGIVDTYSYLDVM